ncbi:MAG: hypothetical protein K2O24_03300 [Muribaculaceae bacterium]|nr:hypothetical protein [Muribaculaceae bacterium]
MKKVKFYLVALTMALTGLCCTATDASAAVPEDVKAVCVIFDTVADQLGQINSGKSVDPTSTIMQLLPYTASATALDAESREALGNSLWNIMEQLMAAGGQKMTPEQSAAAKAMTVQELEEEKTLGPLVTDALSTFMGGEQ